MLGSAALGSIPGVGPAAKAGLAAAKGVRKPGRQQGTVRGEQQLPAGHPRAHGGRDQRAIEDIEIGDLVLATDPRRAKRPASPLIEGHGLKQLVDITVDSDTDGPLTATDGHPFWVDDEAGSMLRPASRARASASRWRPGPHHTIRTYDVAAATGHNLTVADLHTYYVDAGEPVLVHNTSACNPPSRSKRGKLYGDDRAEGFPHTRVKFDPSGNVTGYTTFIRNKRVTGEWEPFKRFRGCVSRTARSSLLTSSSPVVSEGRASSLHMGDPALAARGRSGR
jgi:hypothetical protein